MDCYSDFFSLLSLTQLNNNSLSSQAATAALSSRSSIVPTTSLNELSAAISLSSTGHRILTHSSAAIPLSEEMSAATRAHCGAIGPVLVATSPQYSAVAGDMDMMDSSESQASALSTACRQFSGLKRKRENGELHHRLALGDDAEMTSGGASAAGWAAVPVTQNGHSVMVDVDLQPEREKRLCPNSHHNSLFPPFTTPTAHNGLGNHTPLYMLNNTAITTHCEPSPLVQPSLGNTILGSDPSLGGVGEMSSRNTFASQKLNLCTAGTSVLEEEAGSCMHIHVPGVSVTECPRCLAGEPVYPIDTGAYGALQSIFDNYHGH